MTMYTGAQYSAALANNGGAVQAKFYAEDFAFTPPAGFLPWSS